MNYNIPTMNGVDDSKAFVNYRPCVVPVAKHIAVGGNGVNGGAGFDGGYAGVNAAKEVFGGNWREQHLLNVVVNLVYVKNGLPRQLYIVAHGGGDYSVSVKPKREWARVSMWSLKSSSEVSSSAGKGSGAWSSTIARTACGYCLMCSSSRVPAGSCSSIITVVIRYGFLGVNKAQRYKKQLIINNFKK